MQMELISLELISEWKSLQRGFKWENISSLSIITGINGAGKTHLIELLNNLDDRFVSLTSASEENIILSLPSKQKSSGNILELIEYYKATDNRSIQIHKINESIRINKNLFNTYREKYHSSKDFGEKGSLHEKMQTYQSKISENEEELKKCSIPEYEDELKRIIDILANEKKDLNEETIFEYGKKVYNNLIEIEDFSI